MVSAGAGGIPLPETPPPPSSVGQAQQGETDLATWPEGLQ